MTMGDSPARHATVGNAKMLQIQPITCNTPRTSTSRIGSSAMTTLASQQLLAAARQCQPEHQDDGCDQRLCEEAAGNVRAFLFPDNDNKRGNAVMQSSGEGARNVPDHHE